MSIRRLLVTAVSAAALCISAAPASGSDSVYSGLNLQELEKLLEKEKMLPTDTKSKQTSDKEKSAKRKKA